MVGEIMMVVSIVSMIHYYALRCFTFVGVSLVVNKGYQSLLVEWEDWKDLVILNDIIGVVLELLQYFSGSTFTIFLMRIHRATMSIYGCPTI